MKQMSRLTAIVLMMVSTPALPAETPHPTSQDNRIREVIYSDTQVFRIVGVFRSATQIVFSSGERVEHVALGDTVSWEVAPAENSLFIKPRELAGSTNLIVITRSTTGNRTYTFELSARRGGIGARSADTFFKVVSAIRAKKRPPRRQQQRRRHIPKPSRYKRAQSARRSISPSSKGSGTSDILFKAHRRSSPPKSLTTGNLRRCGSRTSVSCQLSSRSILTAARVSFPSMCVTNLS